MIRSTEGDEKATTTERGSQCVVYPCGWRLWSILISLILGTLLVALDATIIGTAIPKITTDLQSLQDVGWYGSAYLITVTALQPTYGNIYRLFPIKTVYVLAIILFEVGSTLCAVAPRSFVFILGRAVAGVGAAGLLQGALAIIGRIAPLEKRPLYFSIVLSSFGIAVCAGPIMGGAITDGATWRWCFWINLPVGLLAGLMVLCFVRVQNEDRLLRSPLSIKVRELDLFGAVALIAAVACLLIALQWGGRSQPWNSSQVIGLLVGAGVLFATFMALQWHLGERATIPLRILRQRSIMMSCLFIAFLDMAAYTYAYYMPFYFQGAQGVSAVISGVRFLPLVAPQILFVVLSGAAVTKFGYYVPFMIVGSILAAVGTGLLSTLDADSTVARSAGYLVVIGVGLGLSMQQPYTAVQVVLSDEDVPRGNALIVFMQQFGGSIAVPIGETIFLNSLLAQIPRETSAVAPEAVVQAGTINLSALAIDSSVRHALQTAFAHAVRQCMYLAVCTSALAVPCALGMEWKRLKRRVKEEG